MTTTINASNAGSGGLLQTADATGILALQTAGANAVTIDTSQNATFNSTGAMTLPSGTTAQRPASPVLGMTRFNTTTGNPEWYASTGWVNFSDGPPYSVEMYAWGGGGGGASGGAGGGGGGAANGTMSVTPAQSFAVVVGGGGLAMAASAGPGATVVGGGGLAGTQGYGGQGGGYSGIFLTSASQANARLIAGGGGGSSYETAAGGAGGGTTGVAGTAGNLAGGGGGTQSAGGTSVSSVGTALQGGSAGSEGDGGGSGGGGGGYWGGGAGSNTNPGSGGGGGSAYYDPVNVTSATLTAGSGRTPGDSSNALRGSYGNSSTTGNGTQGVFIIRYLGSVARGTGGTVTYSGGYVYHTFTASGTYVA